MPRCASECSWQRRVPPAHKPPSTAPSGGSSSPDTTANRMKCNNFERCWGPPAHPPPLSKTNGLAAGASRAINQVARTSVIEMVMTGGNVLRERSGAEAVHRHASIDQAGLPRNKAVSKRFKRWHAGAGKLLGRSERARFLRMKIHRQERPVRDDYMPKPAAASALSPPLRVAEFAPALPRHTMSPYT